jgi:hypothetical protein
MKKKANPKSKSTIHTTLIGFRHCIANLNLLDVFYVYYKLNQTTSTIKKVNKEEGKTNTPDFFPGNSAYCIHGTHNTPQPSSL